MWLNELADLCHDLKIEINIEKNRLVLFCAKFPEKSQEEKIKELIPSNMELAIVEAPKNSTLKSLSIIYLQAGIIPINMFCDENHILKVRASTILKIEEDNPVWSETNRILKDDGFFRGLEIELNGEKKLFSFEIFKEVNRPKRDTVINSDDILNLKITLNSTESFDDFLGKI